ncbi:phosphopantetheine-binding protein [Streptomyces sp. NPDC001941]|uniref:phosphopantetheine-binding protein n=1 Tax=Streptomyces sp. NPDC001941 TaxID=3154659 RepID=UPI0033210753
MALTLERLRADVADLLGEEPEDIPVDENLVDYGLDSVRLMALVARWREEHGITTAYTDLAERPALEEWVKLLGLPA